MTARFFYQRPPRFDFLTESPMLSHAHDDLAFLDNVDSLRIPPAGVPTPSLPQHAHRDLVTLSSSRSPISRPLSQSFLLPPSLMPPLRSQHRPLPHTLLSDPAFSTDPRANPDFAMDGRSEHIFPVRQPTSLTSECDLYLAQPSGHTHGAHEPHTTPSRPFSVHLTSSNHPPSSRRSHARSPSAPTALSSRVLPPSYPADRLPPYSSTTRRPSEDSAQLSAQSGVASFPPPGISKPHTPASSNRSTPSSSSESVSANSMSVTPSPSSLSAPRDVHPSLRVHSPPDATLAQSDRDKPAFQRAASAPEVRTLPTAKSSLPVRPEAVTVNPPAKSAARPLLERKRSRKPSVATPPRDLDKIDELDETDPLGFTWHVNGPYDAIHTAQASGGGEDRGKANEGVSTDESQDIRPQHLVAPESQPSSTSKTSKPKQESSRRAPSAPANPNTTSFNVSPGEIFPTLAYQQYLMQAVVPDYQGIQFPPPSDAFESSGPRPAPNTPAVPVSELPYGAPPSNTYPLYNENEAQFAMASQPVQTMSAEMEMPRTNAAPPSQRNVPPRHQHTERLRYTHEEPPSRNPSFRNDPVQYDAPPPARTTSHRTAPPNQPPRMAAAANANPASTQIPRPDIALPPRYAVSAQAQFQPHYLPKRLVMPTPLQPQPQQQQRPQYAPSFSSHSSTSGSDSSHSHAHLLVQAQAYLPYDVEDPRAPRHRQIPIAPLAKEVPVSQGRNLLRKRSVAVPVGPLMDVHVPASNTSAALFASRVLAEEPVETFHLWDRGGAEKEKEREREKVQKAGRKLSKRK